MTVPTEPHRLDAIPSGCDCVWTTYVLPDGRRAGSIFIASDACMRFLMHPRTFIEPPKEST